MLILTEQGMTQVSLGRLSQLQLPSVFCALQEVPDCIVLQRLHPSKTCPRKWDTAKIENYYWSHHSTKAKRQKNQRTGWWMCYNTVYSIVCANCLLSFLLPVPPPGCNWSRISHDLLRHLWGGSGRSSTNHVTFGPITNRGRNQA